MSLGSGGSGLFENTTTEQSLTCAEKRLLGGPSPISETASEVFRYLQIVLFVIGFPIGLILNTTVIVLVAKFKSLQQTSFYLALQVIVVDLLITLIQFPTTTANVIANRWVFGAVGCPTIGFLLFTFRNMRNFLMFVLVTDRMLSVFAPFWYYKRNHRKFVIIPLSIASWIFALVYGIIPMPPILDCHEYGKIAWGCTISKGCKYPEVCDAYKITSVVVSNVIGGLIPLVMYIILYCKARSLKRKIAFPRNSGARKQSLISAFSNSTSDTTTSVSAQLTERQRKRDEKATVTFVILFIALIGVSFPSTTFFIIGTSAFNARMMKPPEWFIILTIIFRTLFNFLVIIDPIAIMRNRDVRDILNETCKKIKYKLRGEAIPVVATNYKPRSDQDTSSVESNVTDPQENGVDSYTVPIKNGTCENGVVHSEN